MPAVVTSGSSIASLCPADACQIGDLFCPVGEQGSAPSTAIPAGPASFAAPAVPVRPKFRILEKFDDPIVWKYESFLAENRIAVAGVEFIRDAEGGVYTYDINTNTNYNSDAEAVAGKYGMLEVARFLGEQLKPQS